MNDIDAAILRAYRDINRDHSPFRRAVVSGGSGLGTITIPMRTENPLNSRKHWSHVARVAKHNRQAVLVHLRSKLGDAPQCDVRVTMTRIASGKMDWNCGLNAALKPVRDGAADWLARLRHDDDPTITWDYGQEKAKRGIHAVRIEITRSP